jgi:hypothetical protein
MLLVAQRVKKFPLEQRDRYLVGIPTQSIWTTLPKIRQQSPAAYKPSHWQHQFLHSVKPRLKSSRYTTVHDPTAITSCHGSGVCRRHLNKETLVASQTSPCGICGTQRDIGIGFSE